MLSSMPVAATIAVSDMKRAKEFYEGALGLSPKRDMDGHAVVYACDGSDLFVYVSAHAGGYGATVATWSVDKDIESVVKALAAKGVPFEHYDMPGMVRDGDVHIGGGMKVAWCKDPDGNILCLASGGAGA